MNKITLEEVNQNLMNYLQRVQVGESFMIFQAGQPIAKIVSAKSSNDILEAFDAFRDHLVNEEIDLDSDEVFANVRDTTPTSEKPRW